jgi:fucose 4-O-acetylase-like acetyltransferase
MTFKDKIKAFLYVDDALKGGRNHHIDALKGMGIIMVIFCHTVSFNDPAHFNVYLPFRILDSFIMQLFFFLSGLVLFSQVGKYSLPAYLKKNAIRLLVPLLVWSCIGYVLHQTYRNVDFPRFMLNLAIAPNPWFLWVLFLNSTILFSVLKLVEIREWNRWENYFVIASILLVRAALSTNLFLLSEVRLYYPYYVAGFFVFKYYDELKARRNLLYAAAIVLYPVLAVCYIGYAFPVFYPYLLQFTNEKFSRLIVSVYKYAVAFSGIAFWSFILERLRKTKPYFFLCWTGTISLEIFVCHDLFIARLGNSGLLYVTSTLMALAGSLVLTLLVIKRFRITRLLLAGQNR